MLTLAFDRSKQDAADDDMPPARPPLTLAVIDDHEPEQEQDNGRMATALDNLRSALVLAQADLAGASAEIHSLERRLRENGHERLMWMMAAAAGTVGFLVGAVL